MRNVWKVFVFVEWLGVCCFRCYCSVNVGFVLKRIDVFRKELFGVLLKGLVLGNVGRVGVVGFVSCVLEEVVVE